MIAELKTYLSTLASLSVKDMAAYVRILKIERYKVGEFVVKANSNASGSCYYVVLKGLLRNYVLLSNGEERTMRISHEFMVTADPSSIFGSEKMREAIVALEDSIVAAVDQSKFEKLCHDNPNMLRLYASKLKDGLKEGHEQAWFHTALTPEERYLYISEKYPQFLQRVQIKHLASYIGVTPVSLSRIRARLVKPNQ